MGFWRNLLAKIFRSKPDVQVKCPAQYIQRARRELGIDHINHYNIAICGGSGNGKSLFINYFLQLPEEEAANVEAVECTTEITSYRNKNFPYLLLWDMPGTGVVNHPADTYFSDKKLYAFDCVLIFISDTIKEVDTKIATEARNWEKPFALVRTKADTDVKDLQLTKGIRPMKACGEHLRERVKANFNNQRNMPRGTPLFIISCYYYEYLEEAYKSDKGDDSLRVMDEHELWNFIIDCMRPRLYSYNSSWRSAKLLEGPLSFKQRLEGSSRAY